MSILQQYILPKLPLLLKSLGIAIIISVYKNNLHPSAIIAVTLFIFQILCVISRGNAQTMSYANQGMGFGLGSLMSGGALEEVVSAELGSTDIGSIQKSTRDILTDIEGRIACPSCKTNPYSVDSLKKLAMQSLSPPFQEKAQQLLPVALLPKNIPTASEIIKEPQPVKIFRVGDETITLCQALVQSGFNPKWTIQDVKEMLQTPKGKDKLSKINSQVTELTGMKSISNKDIIRCFPHYYTDYLCRRTVVPTSPSIGDESEQGTEDTVVPQSEFVFQNKAKHCHLDSIRTDIHKSVTLFYTQNIPDYNPERDQQLVITINYTAQRAMLEIKNLINLFQNKPKEEWFQYIADQKAKDIIGFTISSSKYKIPWDIFFKYSVCFGY